MSPRLGMTLVLLLGWRVAFAESLRLILPPVIHAVPGVEMTVEFANTVLLAPGAEESVSFRCECPVGRVEAGRWRLNAGTAEVGEHPFRLTVLDRLGRPVASAETRLIVSPASAGDGCEIRLLLIGDSLTHASRYPNALARLLSMPGNPDWRMLGTHRPSSAADGVAHEGYGGWTWNRFRTRFIPERPDPGKTNSSPFLFAGPDGRGLLDVDRYFRERCGGARPDFIIVLLGINDCFGARPDSPATIDPTLDRMFGEADLLLKALRDAAPGAEIGLCLTPPGNQRDAAFEANYGNRYPRWGWRRIQHRLVERQIRHFANREAERLHLVPTQLNLDALGGYPVNNGVHPNDSGYQQIGATLYAWLKARLAGR
jgi:lysophospholipase L1-like esterase